MLTYKLRTGGACLFFLRHLFFLSGLADLAHQTSNHVGAAGAQAHDAGESSASYTTAADAQTVKKAPKVDANVSGPFPHSDMVSKGKEEAKEDKKAKKKTQEPAKKLVEKDQPDVLNTVRNPSRKAFIWVLSDEAIKAGGVLTNQQGQKGQGQKERR